MDASEVRPKGPRTLLREYQAILDSLRDLGVITTRDSPISGYGQWLICRALDAAPLENSYKGVDAVTKDGQRLQIKTRWLVGPKASRQLGAIRNLDDGLFDFMAAVLLDSDFEVQEAYLIPHSTVVRCSTVVRHSHSSRLVLTPRICSDESIRRITDQVRAVVPDGVVLDEGSPRPPDQQVPAGNPSPLAIISDLTGLTAHDVRHRRVLCPGCGDKLFELWPEGWDAHAAHRCSGLSGTAVQDRKTEFKTRFRHLFL